MADIIVRRWDAGDVPAIARLYYDTVHRVNALDYTPSQIAAWAPRVYPDRVWRRRFRRYQVFVAEQDGEVVGFAELGRDGLVDCFYVRHDRQRRGIGDCLLKRLLRAARRAGARRLYADVSITARPFFRSRGFRVRRWRRQVYRNRGFRQFLMIRPPR